ncbi:MAG: CBS domain-containing protein [Methanoregula sp.]
MKTAQDFSLEIPVLKNSDQITKARQILRDSRFREVYVVDAKKILIGYIDLTDGLRVTATKSNVTVEGFVKDAPMVNPEDSIEQVAKTMRSFHTDSAAVVDSTRHIRGGILLSNLFPVIISRNELHGTVASCMNKNVVAADPADELQKIQSLIIESGFTAFPVINKKRLAGIISRRDLISTKRVRSAVAQHAHTTIEDVMTRDVVTIAPDEPVRYAAELLVKHDISRLPVLEGETLVGIVDRHDILAALA